MVVPAVMGIDLTFSGSRRSLTWGDVHHMSALRFGLTRHRCKLNWLCLTVILSICAFANGWHAAK